MASEGKSLRRIIEDAIQQIETFKNPDVTEAEGVLSDLIKAAGLGDIRGETLAYVSIRDGNVAVRTEYYSRGGSCGEHYDFPEAIIDAADPIATAKEWGLRRKVANLERERDEARALYRDQSHKASDAVRSLSHARRDLDVARAAIKRAEGERDAALVRGNEALAELTRVREGIAAVMGAIAGGREVGK